MSHGGNKERLYALDWMRGIAALLVVGLHTEIALHRPRFFTHGYLAVDLFFMISGFVIAQFYSALLSQPRGLFNFLEVRFIRLFPLALLGSVIGLGMWFTGSVATNIS